MFLIQSEHIKKHGNQYCQCCREAGERIPALWGFKSDGRINAFCESHQSEGEKREAEQKQKRLDSDDDQSEGERQALRGFGIK